MEGYLALIKEQREENNKLQQKINKAIKYINENILCELTPNYDLGKDLLNILKSDGKDILENEKR